MRDPQQAIRTAYLALLQGQMALPEGGAAPVVYADFVPSTASRPYVVLNQQTAADNRTGTTCQSWDTTILVEIVTESQGNLVQTSGLNYLANQAIQLLGALNTREGNEVEGFEITRHFLESSNTLNEEGNGNMIHRRLLRFRDVVFETATT